MAPKKSTVTATPDVAATADAIIPDVVAVATPDVAATADATPDVATVATADAIIPDVVATADANPVAGSDACSTRNCVSDTYAKKVLDFMNADGEVTTGISIKATQTILNGFVRMIITDTAAGRVNSITNFVTFKREARNARNHTNPQTQEVVHVPDHYVMKVEVKPAVRTLMKALPFAE